MEFRWIGETVSEDGVTERRFDLDREPGGTVPGILWTPVQVERPAPLVLMGHGGSGHKRAERQLMLARRFAKEAGFAIAAIDGPYHGDRISTPLEPLQVQEIMSAVGVDKVTDGMVADWSATLDELNKLDVVDANRAAYFGLSMGTRFGLPFVAAAGSRLRCAVFGKNGMHAPTLMNMDSRFRQDAPKLTVPVLFHMQWDDEIFPQDGQFELFDLIGSEDKCLIAYPGPHGGAGPGAVEAWFQFILRQLAELSS